MESISDDLAVTFNDVCLLTGSFELQAGFVRCGPLGCVLSTHAGFFILGQCFHWSKDRGPHGTINGFSELRFFGFYDSCGTPSGADVYQMDDVDQDSSAVVEHQIKVHFFIKSVDDSESGDVLRTRLVPLSANPTSEQRRECLRELEAERLLL